MEKHAEADSINLADSKVQWAAIKMSKKRTEEVSIKLSPSKGDMRPIMMMSNQFFAIFHVNV
ncbi:hypothetical protein KY290_001091 [Solanum tuberosum]|uniref:Uncharacterized protein n=1 Tax=Solanum tuberosum TaxID=4113 RepID=A0ABQ7WL84_SOLTU|nr:hypothetical protein KY290_001091 [Solanum tuberosum]